MLPISSVLFCFHKPHLGSISRGWNVGAQSCNMTSIFQFQPELVIRSQRRADRRTRISVITKAVRSFDCHAMRLCHLLPAVHWQSQCHERHTDLDLRIGQHVNPRTAGTQKSASMLFDSRQLSTFLVAQSMMATRYKKPRRIGM